MRPGQVNEQFFNLLSRMDESSRKRAGHGSISDSEHNEAGPSGNVSLGILPEVSEETTRLFLHLSRKGDMDAITNLISQGIGVNASDCDNRTALHFASCSGHKKVVEFLLQMGANVNAQDRFGSTVSIIYHTLSDIGYHFLSSLSV